MNKNLIFFLIVIGIFAAGLGYRYLSVSGVAQKIYVAVEGDGKIAVIDQNTRKVIRNIDLSTDHEGGKLFFAPHNVQVSPDQKSVWVTANVGDHQDHAAFFVEQVLAHGEEEEETIGEPDEVIVINPENDRIVKRIQIKAGIHLAHVVLTPDSKLAYATAQEESVIYKIDALTYEIVKRIEAAEKSEPHGIRISSDGLFLYAAMLAGKSLGIVDLKTDTFSEIPLGGQAVQTGVTPDGKFVVVSLYDTKQLAVYSVETKSLSFVKLPESSMGPIQMYPTPDSKFIYLADQGYYFEQPSSQWVYKIELASGRVVKEVKAGSAPHGVVVSNDGNFVYVTNLLSDDVSVIDTAKDEEVGRIKVGKFPNGISTWTKNK
ncbi:MAG: hypothetical protein A3G49_06120 [Candidatus Sungbacteria bacterium RIFCSPLOWO2_12_FULL_41_11]|uniref:YNCE-like beta-propeller domain-containing protein n=1 Tax=Candidatus Sungbacteria bacterium RIFCSPLOWO2_12_FULL_41_11 TaxID=1802286 RepID=A0A1G2LT34_9BACT|nr:MAG: 40-residue YVTN family beta-propeller repeat protein [Parcubacteria group bacterium GW2011_GWA2_42_14]OHA14012.1 MAG: hypothetical protein A3G49_06120 [Candidatus Sungbacteria bacterium RIFCSPLOWO2_12_FULL_41_11]